MVITSPYDVEARYSRKKSTAWNGYKVHFTQTCEVGAPHLIVEVTFSSATTADGESVGDLHEQLAKRQMLPGQHWVDVRYIDAEVMAESQKRYQVEIIGPVMPDLSWASKETGRFDARHLLIDWLQIPDRHGKPSLRVWFPGSRMQTLSSARAMYGRSSKSASCPP